MSLEEREFYKNSNLLNASFLSSSLSHGGTDYNLVPVDKENIKKFIALNEDTRKLIDNIIEREQKNEPIIVNEVQQNLEKTVSNNNINENNNENNKKKEKKEKKGSKRRKKQSDSSS